VFPAGREGSSCVPDSKEQTGPVALVGSGEYLPVMQDVERDLLEGRPPRYVQLATAAVPDGADVVDHWHRLGREQAERLGVECVVVPVASRSDAEDPAMAALIGEPGLIYLSGGHPDFLADTLRGTLVWNTIVSAWRGGAALAGCSAGAMAMTQWIPSLRHPREGGTEGLGLLPHLRVIPHFDRFAARVPNVVDRFLISGDENITVLGIDEDTALVGGPHEWVVKGTQSVWRLRREGREEFPVGSSLQTT